MLANLFMHYAFDTWLEREFPAVRFERYADDAVVHCATERQAREVLAALETRMAEVGLELHPDKTKIVYCKDRKRRQPYDGPCKFTFLGYEFRARKAPTRDGTSMFAAFLPAVSKDALKRMSGEVRRWRINLRTTSDIAELAEWMNPVIRGSLGVLSPLHDVAVKRFTESFCNTSVKCGARCRRCSEPCPPRTCNMRNTPDHRRR